MTIPIDAPMTAATGLSMLFSCLVHAPSAVSAAPRPVYDCQGGDVTEPTCLRREVLEAPEMRRQDAQHLLSLTGMAHNLSCGYCCCIPSPLGPRQALLQPRGVLV